MLVQSLITLHQTNDISFWTTEGRIVTQVLDESGKEYYYSTKGDLQQVDFVHGIRLTGAMTEEALIDFIQQNDIELVIDAAHPFAAVLHNTIGLATAQTGTPVIRYERVYPKKQEGIIECTSYDDMIEKLEAQPCHRLLALTGSTRVTSAYWIETTRMRRVMPKAFLENN